MMPAAGTATLHLEQHVDPTPGQPDKTVMPIPLRTALIGAKSGAEIAAERLILLDQAEAAVTLRRCRRSRRCCRSTAIFRRR